MSNYYFCYSIIAWTKKTPSKRVPSGGAWCKEGAREIIKNFEKQGFRVSHAIVTMHDKRKPHDWNHPVSERKLFFRK